MLRRAGKYRVTINYLPVTFKRASLAGETYDKHVGGGGVHFTMMRKTGARNEIVQADSLLLFTVS